MTPIMSTRKHNSTDGKLTQARQAKARGDFLSSRTLYEKIYQKNNKNIEALSSLAYLNMDLSNLGEAYGYAAELAQLMPEDLNVGMMMSVILMRLGKLDEARALLMHMRTAFPDRIEILHNLHSVETQAKRHQEAAQFAMAAIEKSPTDPHGYNNLGASMSALGLNQQAKAAFEVVIALQPGHGTANANLALILAGEGKINEAIELLEKILRVAEAKHDEGNIQALRHNLGFQYLKVGRLAEGWSHLESGFSSHIDQNRGRRPQRSFQKPRWKGQALKGKTLMVWREQGLGDEILFSTCLKELVGIDGKVIVECETRLIKTLARSFPEFHFRDVAYYNKPGLPAYHHDYDYQIPVGSLCSIFRQKIEDFDRSGPYIVVNPERAQIYRNRIAEAVSGGEKKRLIGICWRSGVIEPTRSSGYTNLDAWEEIFALPGIQLVNLQYGKCEEELLAVEEKFNIKILRWSDLNLQTDLDDVFALMSCLDEVVTVATAVNTMAAAVGLPVRLISKGRGWTLLGSGRYPFFRNVQLYRPDRGQPLREVIKWVSSDIANACRE
jgi:Flp pilus assembly protein TadD